LSAEKIPQFFKAYVESKNGKITQNSKEILSITYPNESTASKYTFESSVARENKIPLIATGSLAFQQVLKECLENGALSQISVAPKGNYEVFVRKYFKDTPHDCGNCKNAILIEENNRLLCSKAEPCFHQINNAKITSVKVSKKEPARFFQLYFCVTFQNKLRAKNEEIIKLLMDEKGNFVDQQDFESDFDFEALEITDFSGKIKAETFESLRSIANERIALILKQKVAIFDLTIIKAKKEKLTSFVKRLKRERREHVISKRNDFDYLKWQNSFEALLKREEESCTTNVSVKLVNLLIINTNKVHCEIILDNKSTIPVSFILGITPPSEVTCPLCKEDFTEGYATKDHLYICKNCTRQSIDSGKIYSTKTPLTLDPALNEYIEKDAGFICTVCGKRYSKLLEFKCTHDNSSVCIYHYELCDMCGKVFSKINLSYTEEFKRQLCPKHAGKEKGKEK